MPTHCSNGYVNEHDNQSVDELEISLSKLCIRTHPTPHKRTQPRLWPPTPGPYKGFIWCHFLLATLAAAMTGDQQPLELVLGLKLHKRKGSIIATYKLQSNITENRSLSSGTMRAWPTLLNSSYQMEFTSTGMGTTNTSIHHKSSQPTPASSMSSTLKPATLSGASCFALFDIYNF